MKERTAQGGCPRCGALNDEESQVLCPGDCDTVFDQNGIVVPQGR